MKLRAFLRPVAGAALALFLASCTGANRPQAVAQWQFFNGDLAGGRYAQLSAIDTSNVHLLQPVCNYKMPESGAFQTGPVVVDNVMYVTSMHATVALDAATCAVKWSDMHKAQGPEPYNTNRGVAYLDGKVFRGFQDGHLTAFDAATGKILWDVVAGDAKKAEFLSAAPVAWNGMVFIGIAGADWGDRGRMMAFDAGDGHRIWSFDLIPTGSQTGANTWGKADSAATGGGSTWTTYSLDTSSGELYVPVGNPAPDFSPQYRPGDNLFTDSVVVLDAKTGKLGWYHQFVKNDSHDWDIAAAPPLITTKGGKQLAIATGKDAMLYALDRTNHNLVYSTAVSERENTTAVPTAAGVHVCPGWIGGTEWNGPAYSPDTNLLYDPSVSVCGTYKIGEARYTQGSFFLGGAFVPDPPAKSHGWLTAIDADSGKVAWKYRSPTPMIGAVTVTKTGLVFTGDLNGNLMAFDAANGKKLASVKTPGAIAGGIVTYDDGGTQYVATTSGNISRLTWGSLGSPSIYVYAIKH